jgi:hypothetical protein
MPSDCTGVIYLSAAVSAAPDGDVALVNFYCNGTWYEGHLRPGGDPAWRFEQPPQGYDLTGSGLLLPPDYLVPVGGHDGVDFFLASLTDPSGGPDLASVLTWRFPDGGRGQDSYLVPDFGYGFYGFATGSGPDGVPFIAYDEARPGTSSNPTPSGAELLLQEFVP